MKKLLPVLVAFVFGVAVTWFFDGAPPRAEAGGGVECAAKNGDVNGDGTLDIADGIYIINHQFRGGPAPLPLECTPVVKGLPDTRQTKCYDSAGGEIPCDSATCPGQDGSYATGCPSEGRFTDNGEGTVTDNCTGLMWQKDTADVNGDGQSTSEDVLPWCDALAYCENLSFGGGAVAWDDWRLPNVRELQSIVDYGRFSPAIDPVFGAFSNHYWSSTSVASIPDVAWGGYFGVGVVDFNGKGLSHYVRAVRSGP